MTIGMAYVNRKVSGIEWGNNGPSRESCSSDSQLEKGKKSGWSEKVRELEDVFPSLPLIYRYIVPFYIYKKNRGILTTYEKFEILLHPEKIFVLLDVNKWFFYDTSIRVIRKHRKILVFVEIPRQRVNLT